MKWRKSIRGREGKGGVRPGVRAAGGAEAPAPAPVRISVIDYDEEHLLDRQVEGAEACAPFKDKPTVTWINVDGVHDAALIQALGERFGLHPLVQEDILSNIDQRPKVEDFEEYVFVAIKMLQWDAAGGRMTIEQVSLVLGRNFVISFQQRPGDVFEPVRNRIRTGKGRIRKMGADYLAYSLLDAIVDGYFVILERRGEQVEAVEEELVSHPVPATLQKIHRLRRDGLFLRKSVWPVRELVAALERAESPLVGPGVNAYFRDLYDHTIQAIDTAETFREMLSGMLDTYLSSLSNRMNEVMKVLTIIATIFIPLTFIAGVYGMNFRFMPELDWRWGYAAAMGLMAAVAAGMVFYIKRKKWM